MASDTAMSFPSIQGIDTAKGIAMTGGTIESYRQVLSMFRKDAEERIQKFRFFLYESMSSGTGKLPEKHLSSFSTQVHALKSASATIGAEEISAEAGRLEDAAKNKDLAFIEENLPDFVEHMAELVKNIRAVLETKPDKNEPKSGGLGFLGQLFAKQKPGNAAPAKEDPSGYLPLFQKLAEALESQNVSDIDQIMDELSQKPLDSKTREILEHISDQVLMTEFDSARKTVDGLIDTNK